MCLLVPSLAALAWSRHDRDNPKRVDPRTHCIHKGTRRMFTGEFSGISLSTLWGIAKGSVALFPKMLHFATEMNSTKKFHNFMIGQFRQSCDSKVCYKLIVNCEMVVLHVLWSFVTMRSCTVFLAFIGCFLEEYHLLHYR